MEQNTDTPDFANPPVVATSDWMDERRLKVFLHRACVSNPDPVAKCEALRLSAYFNALSVRLQKSGLAVPSVSDIAAAFQNVTAETRNVITSVPAISTGQVIRDEEADAPHGATAISTFFKRTSYASGQYTLGFYQCQKKGPGGIIESSLSIPALQMDHRISYALGNHDPEPLFSALQPLMTFGNHDMLHHFTNTYLNNDIARLEKKPSYAEKLTDLAFNYFGFGIEDANPLSYESWALLSHAATSHELLDSPAESRLRAAIDTYYTQLSRIARFLPDERTNEITDYLATTPAFILMRVVPIDHPLINDCLTRAEQVMQDPDYVYTADILCFSENEIAALTRRWTDQQRQQAIAAIMTMRRQAGTENGMSFGWHMTRLLSDETKRSARDFDRMTPAGLTRKILAHPQNYALEKKLAKDISHLALNDHALTPDARKIMKQLVSDSFATDSINPLVDRTLKNYQNSGLDLSTPTYRTVKIRQLIRMAPDIASLIAPAPAGSLVDLMKRRVDDFDASLLKILTNPAGPKP